MLMILLCVCVSGSNPDRPPFRSCPAVCAQCAVQIVVAPRLFVRYIRSGVAVSLSLSLSLSRSFAGCLVGSVASSALPMARVVTHDCGSSSDDILRKFFDLKIMMSVKYCTHCCNGAF